MDQHNRLVRVESGSELTLDLARSDRLRRQYDEHAGAGVQGLVNRVIPVGTSTNVLPIHPQTCAGSTQVTRSRLDVHSPPVDLDVDLVPPVGIDTAR